MSALEAGAWSVVNTTRLQVHALLTTDIGSAPFITVVLKGTFLIPRQGECPWADDAIPILEADEPNEFKVPGSVRFESDLAPLKPSADVILVGRAYAPGGKPVQALVATLTVARMSRSIAVFGDRVWKRGSGFTSGPAMTSPEPFLSMDVIYERAFGGIDLDDKQKGEWSRANPVGTGIVAKARRGDADGTPLPNIEDPSDLIASIGDRPKPVGFGYCGRGWEPRVKYAGTYDKRWRDQRAPLRPHDIDPRYFNGAHPDLQSPKYLAGGERVEIVNLCPSREKVEFELPRVRPRVALAGPGIDGGAARGRRAASPVDLPLNLDTVCFIPDEDKLYMIWRGARAVAGPADVSEVTVGVDAPR